MIGFNRIFLMGYLGANPEVQTSKSGKSYVRLSVSTHHGKRTEEGSRETKTVWHRVTVWGNQAESCQKFLQKGAAVAVEGYLSKYSYEREDGADANATSIVARNVHFIGKRSDSDVRDTFAPSP